MTENRVFGWSLVAAVAIGFVGSLLTPGGMLIDPVGSSSFEELAGALGDNGQIAQIATSLTVVAALLYWFGLHSLKRAFSGPSVIDGVSRFALTIFLVGYAFLVAELSVRHVLTHVLEHGVGGSAAEERAMATTLFAAAVGLHFAFLYVTAIGSAVFGSALARRCRETDIFKLAAMGLALTGILSFVVLMIAEHIPAVDLHGVALFSNIVLLFGSLCILVIGVGIIQGRREFVGEEAAV